MANKNFIAILMGSDSDLPTMKKCIDVLTTFEVYHEVKILSAHRTPQQTMEYVKDAEQRGCSAFICAAGLAAHLAGAVAANTIKPVIGVPMDAGPLQGMDALLSTVQMPGGIPVACVAIGSAGARNAGFLACQILAVSDNDLAKRLLDARELSRKTILEKDLSLQQQLASENE